MSRLLTSLVGGTGGRALGSMLGGRTGGMVGGILGSMLGSRAGRGGSGALGGLMSQLTGAGRDDGGQDTPVEPASEDDAALLIAAMVNAAKADGEVDQAEIDAIMGELGDLDADEEEFLRSQFASDFTPAETLAAAVPPALAAQAYGVSLLAIKVDDFTEVAYMDDLAAALGLDQSAREAIHQELGGDDEL
jgi:uncharacterized membrane protein YebE (DUF533 family)